MRRCEDAPSITTLTQLPTAILNPIVVLVETDQELKRGGVPGSDVAPCAPRRRA
jgi:hypothetical protein